MQKQFPTNEETRYLFNGKFVSDDELYALYSEALDIFHGSHPDNSSHDAAAKRSALLEMYAIGLEADRRQLRPGHSFEPDKRANLVQTEFNNLRKKNETHSDTPGNPPEPPREFKKRERRGTETARRPVQRQPDNPGQLNLFG